MSCIMIQDGSGKGYLAKVNSENRIETVAITFPEVAHISAEDQQAYVVASDFVSLTTTGSFNGIQYIKNTSTTKNLHVERIRVCSSEAGHIQCKLIKNPTTGTLISDANEGTKVNSNFSSNNLFQGLTYAASADGKTITDGTQSSNFIIKSPGHTIQDYQGALILGPSDSLALVCKPSATTVLCSEMQVYFEDM